MHEASAVQSILEILEQKISNNELKHPIFSIHLKLGKLTTFVPSNLQFLFEVFTKGTPFEKTLLIIEEIPVECTCKRCKQDFIMDEVHFICPYCFSTDLLVNRGREFFIDSIEVPNE
ncbi:MAG: hydrogenase maturation nickel metallochaperone HypA [bacterium]|nr:hydrogenase maturation nickel metallochaperone HypA [bacterium]